MIAPICSFSLASQPPPLAAFPLPFSEVTLTGDWGDICAGDRATDLAGAFMLVPGHIDTVADHAGADDAAWERARGWAAHFAVVYLAHSDDDPIMERIGTDLFTTLLAL